MKAVVFHGIGDIRLDEVPEPHLEKPTDAIVKLTASAICGTDLHMVRGTLPGMVPGTILGHEGVGVVESVGKGCRNLREGDRVVICSSIACGNCAYCRVGYYSQCDVSNPNGKQAGTAFFGGPKDSGPFHGLQAEKARIPYAHVGLVALPDEVLDEQAILISDIFPTGYFGAECAEIKPGDTVAVFGCGPVGMFAIVSAKLLGAGRVFAIDHEPSRIEAARRLGAEVINFEEEDPLEVLAELTDGIGPDRVIDAVGVDAEHAHHGPAAKAARKQQDTFEAEVHEVAPGAKPKTGWKPGDAPSQALQWAVQCVAKGGTVSIVGVYPDGAKRFPIGVAMNKNLTLKMGNVPHRKYVPKLIELVRTGVVDPAEILSHVQPMTNAIEAYRAFDARQPGWMKVELEPELLT